MSAFYRQKRRSWTLLKMLARVCAAFVFFLCVLAFSLLVSGIVFKLSSHLVAPDLLTFYFGALTTAAAMSLLAAIPRVFRAYSSARSTGVSYPLTQIFRGEGFVSEISGLKSEFDWRHVSDFVVAAQYYLLLHRAGYYASVPRSAFAPDDQARFEQFCRHAINSAQAQPRG